MRRLGEKELLGLRGQTWSHAAPQPWAAAAEGKCSRKEMDIALLTPAAAFPPRANTMTQLPQQQLDGLTTEIKPQFLQVPKVILGHFALTMQHLESVNSIQSSQRPQ